MFKGVEKLRGEITVQEYSFVEEKLLFLVQRESFIDVSNITLNGLIPFVYIKELIRIKTKISNRGDTNDFCYPIVFPDSKHPVVFRLIEYT